MRIIELNYVRVHRDSSTCSTCTLIKILKMDQQKPSEAELEILQILWQNQPCSVRVVHEKISLNREIGYTTTLKQIETTINICIVIIVVLVGIIILTALNTYGRCPK